MRGAGSHIPGWAALLCCAVAVTAEASDPNKPESYADIREHFKYGSIGAEERAGIPYWIWIVLPDLFPQHLPKRTGKGYERFGLIFEDGQKRPIGTSLRERQVPIAGSNCAVCHTGSLRDSPDGPRRIILGMPAHQFDLRSYRRFLFACVRDREFTAERILPAIRRLNPDFSWFDSLIYRWFVISRTRSEGAALAKQFAWFDDRPPQGPGRVDTFNPYKVMFGFDMSRDHSVGTADLPPLFDQQSREGLWLHWDGNNNLVTERNKSAAIGAGASAASLDLPAMKRVEDWIWQLKPPPFPRERVDAQKAALGKPLYERYCSACHAHGGKRTGTTIPIEEIGTDPERVKFAYGRIEDAVWRTPPMKEGHSMTIRAKDGTRIYYKDWAQGQPIVFSHGWPITAEQRRCAPRTTGPRRPGRLHPEKHLAGFLGFASEPFAGRLIALQLS